MADIRSEYTDSINFFAGHSPRSLAAKYGTPLYVYSEAILRQRCREVMSMCSVPGFGADYSVKANTNPAILSIVREEGLMVDAMSPGELYMDKIAGFTSKDIVYISNNISPDEMHNAIDNGLLVSVDSLSQLDMYGRFNPGGDVMIRFNPGVGAGHSAKVITAGKATKFAVSPEDRDEAFSLVRKYGLRLTGVNQHIGSQFLETEQYLRAVDFLLAFVSEFPEDMLRNLYVLDFGGGFGIPYHKDTEKRLDLRAVGRSMDEKLTAWMEKTGYQGRFLVEPGRYIVGECGLLLGSVEAVKNNGERRYVGTDLGFNVLVRPVMYDSFHEMEIYAGSDGGRPVMEQTITGNICESGDILAKNRSLPEIREGDLIGVLDAGAYGFSMSSTYNERMRPAEVLLTTDGKDRLIRRRETLEDLSSCLA